MGVKNTQVINTVLIIVGGGILMYSITTEEKNQFLQIIGLIIIMFGLYRATNFWVQSEKKEDDEDDEIDGDKREKEDKEL